MDEMLAKFVVDSHFKSTTKGGKADDKSTNNSQEDIQDSAMLEVDRLRDVDLDKLAQVYAELRRESSHGQGLPIAVTHIESMIRVSEAHARMHLRQHVTQEDVDMAIRILLDSFISTQKFGVQKSFKKYMTFKRDFNAIVLHLLDQLVKEAVQFEEIMFGANRNIAHIDVKVEELQSKTLDYGLTDLNAFFITLI